jgi:hypothetical protein
MTGIKQTNLENVWPLLTLEDEESMLPAGAFNTSASVGSRRYSLQWWRFSAEEDQARQYASAIITDH